MIEARRFARFERLAAATDRWTAAVASDLAGMEQGLDTLSLSGPASLAGWASPRSASLLALGTMADRALAAEAPAAPVPGTHARRSDPAPQEAPAKRRAIGEHADPPTHAPPVASGRPASPRLFPMPAVARGARSAPAARSLDGPPPLRRLALGTARAAALGSLPSAREASLILAGRFRARDAGAAWLASPAAAGQGVAAPAVAEVASGRVTGAEPEAGRRIIALVEALWNRRASATPPAVTRPVFPPPSDFSPAPPVVAPVAAALTPPGARPIVVNDAAVAGEGLAGLVARFGALPVSDRPPRDLGPPPGLTQPAPFIPPALAERAEEGRLLARLERVLRREARRQGLALEDLDP